MQNQTRFTFIITETVSRSALYHRIFQPQKAADTSPTNLLQLEPTNLQSKKINIIFDNIIRVFRKANFSVLKKSRTFFWSQNQSKFWRRNCRPWSETLWFHELDFFRVKFVETNCCLIEKSSINFWIFFSFVSILLLLWAILNMKIRSLLKFKMPDTRFYIKFGKDQA